MNKEEILDFLKENKSLLEKKYNVKKIGLFGSFVNGSQKKTSDIDILVSMPSSFDNYYDLKEFLESGLNIKIDLGLENNLREFIKNKVKEEIIYV